MLFSKICAHHLAATQPRIRELCLGYGNHHVSIRIAAVVLKISQLKVLRLIKLLSAILGSTFGLLGSINCHIHAEEQTSQGIYNFCTLISSTYNIIKNV